MSEKIAFISGGRFVSRGRGRHPARKLDSTELIQVISGVLRIREEDCDYTVRPGEFLFLDAGRRHEGSGDYPRELEFFWGHFSGNRPPECRKYGPAVRPGNCEDYWSLLLAEQNTPDHAAVCDLLLQILLLETARRPPASGLERHTGRAARLAALALRLIGLRCIDNFSTADLACELHCNPNYLGRLLRREYGASPVELLNRARLDRAARQLRETGCSIKEAAFANGFNDPAWFRKQFRRRFAVLPSEYQKLRIPGHANTE